MVLVANISSTLTQISELVELNESGSIQKESGSPLSLRKRISLPLRVNFPEDIKVDVFITILT